METRRLPSILKFWPSFGDIALLLPAMLLFGRMNGVKTVLADGDTGWHIRTGEWILAHHSVPRLDIFSFSMPGQPWFAWEWLSDILLAGMNRVGGLRGVALFSILLVSVVYALIFRLICRRTNVIVATLIAVVVAAASSTHWLARPHLFTLLFLVLFYAALEQVRDGRTRLAGIPYLAILPAATVLWTNLHGGFFIGILMIGAYGGGEVLKMVLSENRGESRATWEKAGWYFASALGCLAASLINPYSYRLHVHILAYLRDPFYAQHINEFLSPNFHDLEVVFFEGLLVLAAAAGCWHLSKGRYHRAAAADDVGPRGAAVAAEYRDFRHGGGGAGGGSDSGVAGAGPGTGCTRMAAPRIPGFQPAGGERQCDQ